MNLLLKPELTVKEGEIMGEIEKVLPKKRGRPRKEDAEFSKLVKVKSVDALEKLISITEDENAKPELVIKACETVMAYGYGKPGAASDSKKSDDVKVVIDYE